MRIALFVPCFVDQLYPRVAEATIHVLQRAGVDELIFPKSQVCCGQPAFNSGYWEEAREVAGRWLGAFSGLDVDAIVSPSGSCVAMVRRHFQDLWPDGEGGAGRSWHEWSRRLAPMTYELTEFLTKVLDVDQLGARCPLTVVLHDSCHHRRILDAKDCPRRLLRQVEGLCLVEPEQSELCCGFGGTFAVKYGVVSAALAERKARNLAATGADVVTGTDMSCLMHIHGWMKKNGIRMRAYHLAEILAGALDGVVGGGL